MNNKSLVYGRCYPFTNENLVSYSKLFNFKDANVLSVLGSGDQYFSFKLFGAKNIELFDINNLANCYFSLKFYSILFLSYEEFIDFFVVSKLDNLTLYNKVKDYLPFESRSFFDEVIKRGRKLSSLIYNVSLNYNKINYSTDRVVPYFNRDNYYILKEMLSRSEYPVIRNVSISCLFKELDGKFNFMFFSNIFLHLNLDVREYRKLLQEYMKSLKCDGIIQANYSWFLDENERKEFTDCGFNVFNVPSIRYVSEEDKLEDYVFTLKKS